MFRRLFWRTPWSEDFLESWIEKGASRRVWPEERNERHETTAGRFRISIFGPEGIWEIIEKQIGLNGRQKDKHREQRDGWLLSKKKKRTEARTKEKKFA